MSDNPGRELDIFIGEKIMGNVKLEGENIPSWVEALRLSTMPRYSTSWDASGPLLERFGLDLLQVYKGWMAGRLLGEFGTESGYVEGKMRPYAVAETAPHAICLAVLKVEKIEWPPQEGAV